MRATSRTPRSWIPSGVAESTVVHRVFREDALSRVQDLLRHLARDLKALAWGLGVAEAHEGGLRIGIVDPAGHVQDELYVVDRCVGYMLKLQRETPHATGVKEVPRKASSERPRRGPARRR